MNAFFKFCSHLKVTVFWYIHNKQFGRNILMFLQHIGKILSEYKVWHPTRM